jgi:hypothetical protein
MSSPFPGMNPYLENRELWAEVQSRLIIAIAEFLPQLRTKYRADVIGQMHCCNSKDYVKF